MSNLAPSNSESTPSQPMRPLIGEFGPAVSGYRQVLVEPADFVYPQVVGGSLLPAETIQAGLDLLPDDLYDHVKQWQGDWNLTVRAMVAADLKGNGRPAYKFWILGREDQNGRVPESQLLAGRTPAGVLIGFNSSDTVATAQPLHIAEHAGTEQVGVRAARGRSEVPLFGVELYQYGHIGVHNTGYRAQGRRFLGYNKSPLFIACAPDRPTQPITFLQRAAKRVAEMTVGRVVEGLRAA